MLDQALEPVKFLAKLDDIQLVEGREKGWAAQYDTAFELYVDLARYVDIQAELERLDKEIGKTEKERASIDKTLSNPNFTARAPAEKVEAAHAKKAEVAERLEKLQNTRAELAEL